MPSSSLSVSRGSDPPARTASSCAASATPASSATPVTFAHSSSAITAAVAFLASDEARYVTGVALPVDAGMLVR